MSEINYLEPADIIEAHKQGFYTFGGSTYVVHYSCVAKRAIEPQTSFYGEEQYPGLFLKAAVYLHRLATSHCFADGNKRAAIISTDLFLKFNNYRFVVSQDELFNYCYKIANHETRPILEEVEDWIRQHTKPYTFGLD